MEELSRARGAWRGPNSCNFRTNSILLVYRPSTIVSGVLGHPSQHPTISSGPTTFWGVLENIKYARRAQARGRPVISKASCLCALRLCAPQEREREGMKKESVEKLLGHMDQALKFLGAAADRSAPAP